MNRRYLAVVLAGLTLAAPSMAQPQITRDSTGARRAQLEAMELKEFPADAWSKLTAWSGEPLTAADLQGKPVLIFAFAAFQPASQRASAVAQQMVERYGKDGLVVVGVHAPGGWDRAANLAKERNLTFPMAHDSTGQFAGALHVGNMPDWYVIDRAGHLRYAAVATSSVDAAAAEVSAETFEQASELPRILKEGRQREEAASGRSIDLRPNVDLSMLPPVPPGYMAPGEAAYDNERLWPKMNEENGTKFGLIDQQTKRPLKPRLNFQPTGFYPREPVMEGRALVIYLWHPDIHQSYATVLGSMDLLQRRHQRDLAVIGAATPARLLDQQRGTEQEDAERLMRKYQNFIKARNFRHALAGDFTGSALGSLGQGQAQGFPLPGAMIVSTDGVIRWVGPLERSDFNYALDTVLANDPGIRARREAERRFIENASR
jgi:peroxiredoxin